MMKNMTYFSTAQEIKNLRSKSEMIGIESCSTYAHRTSEKLNFHLCKYFKEKFDGCTEHATIPNQLKSEQGTSFSKKMKNSNISTYIKYLKSDYNLNESIAKASRKKYDKTKKPKKGSHDES